MPSYSKNQKAAKDFLRWAHSKPVYEKWFISQQGFATPTTPSGRSIKVWDEDPVMAPYKVAGQLGLSARLRRSFRQKGGRGALEVHHRRHVRQGRCKACRPRKPSNGLKANSKRSTASRSLSFGRLPAEALANMPSPSAGPAKAMQGERMARWQSKRSAAFNTPPQPRRQRAAGRRALARRSCCWFRR